MVSLRIWCAPPSPRAGTSAAVLCGNAEVLQRRLVVPAGKPARGQKSQSQGAGGASRQSRVPAPRGNGRAGSERVRSGVEELPFE